MADQRHLLQSIQQQQLHKQQLYGGGGDKPNPDLYSSSEVKGNHTQRGPSASQIIAVITLVPLGGTLFLLAGLTLAGSFIGLALSTPLFLIFSPILVPAIAIVGLAVAGILVSGAFGITGLSSFSWLANFLRRTHLPEQAFRGVQQTTSQWTQKAREVGHTVSDKAHDISQAVQGKAHEVGHTKQTKAQEGGQHVQAKAQEVGQKAQDAGKTREVKVT